MQPPPTTATPSGWRPRGDIPPTLSRLLIEALLICRNTSRTRREYSTADVLRNALRAVGVRLSDQEKVWSPSEKEEGTYDHGWHERASQLQLVSLEALLARSISWRHTPKLQTYRGLTKEGRWRIAHAFGEEISRTLASSSHDQQSPLVLAVEKPFIEGFAAGFKQARAAASSAAATLPFVLLALNGGDSPLTRTLQATIATLRCHGLVGCLANDLHRPLSHLPPSFFRPLPIGVSATLGGAEADEATIRRVRSSGTLPPWSERDDRLLVAPMKLSSRCRAAYLEVLTRPEYSGLVRIVDQRARLPFEEFLLMMASHKCVLSPPGRGHDCFRTWQALCVGTVPLVVDDPAFDDGLLALGPVVIPSPSNLTPEALRGLLASLKPPDEAAVGMDYWKLCAAQCLRLRGSGDASSSSALDASSLSSALPQSIIVDIPVLVERALRMQIEAGKLGKLTAEQARGMVEGTDIVRRNRDLSSLPLERVTPLIRHIYTRHVSWALFTQEYCDALHKLFGLLINGRRQTARVLEVCAGSGALVNPMRERGVEWSATDANPPKVTLGEVKTSGALAAVLEAAPAKRADTGYGWVPAEIDAVFFAWWSKPKKPKRKQADEDAEEAVVDDPVPEDCRLVAHCLQMDIPVVFLSEPEGGLTGSPELWAGEYQIIPAAELVKGFVDVTRWKGFTDSTYVILPRNSDVKWRARSEVVVF